MSEPKQDNEAASGRSDSTEVLERAFQYADTTTDDRGRITYSFDEWGIASFASALTMKVKQECADVCDQVPIRVGNDGIWRCEVKAAILAPRSNACGEPGLTEPGKDQRSWRASARPDCWAKEIA